MLEQQSSGHRVHVSLATASLAAHLAHGSQYPCGGHALIPHCHLQLTYAALDIIRECPRGVSGITLFAGFVQRKSDNDTYNVVMRDLFEQLRHGKALAGAARKGGERSGEGLGLIGKGEPNSALAPVHSQKPASCFHPWDIVWKNSLLVLVRFSRSSRNSIASTGGMSDRKLRSR